MNRRYGLSVSLSFIFGITVGVFAPRLARSGIDRVLFPVHRQEIARITSPDGIVDAVLQLENCGAPCPLEYSISVLPRGELVPTGASQNVLVATAVVNPQIRWSQDHLLEVAYDRAFIDSFRNVLYPLGKFGNEESWRYGVEIRLAPSSAGFSYLRDGNKTGDAAAER